MSSETLRTLIDSDAGELSLNRHGNTKALIMGQTWHLFITPGKIVTGQLTPPNVD
jgi:hypothetical protein